VWNSILNEKEKEKKAVRLRAYDTRSRPSRIQIPDNENPQKFHTPFWLAVYYTKNPGTTNRGPIFIPLRVDLVLSFFGVTPSNGSFDFDQCQC